MNQQALHMFRELSLYEEDMKLFKEYLERLFSNIDEENAEGYWEDFVDIAAEMIDTLVKLGYASMKDYYDKNLKEANVTDETFRHIIRELYTLTVEWITAYEENIRCCFLCKEKVYYLPLPEMYNEMRERYQVPKGKAETLNEKEYICPVCGSLDRDRLIMAYLEQCEHIKSSEASLLQIAPSKVLEEYLLANYPNLNYASGDLYMQGVSFQIDLQDMHMIQDNGYDIWICSHVLEHVPDDRKALKELYRILTKNGRGLLLVPLDLDMLETDEEIGCSEEENWRRFGQGDHVRKYAKHDFINRILESGFSLECLGKDFFGEKIYKDNGFLDTATLYVVRK